MALYGYHTLSIISPLKRKSKVQAMDRSPRELARSSLVNKGQPGYGKKQDEIISRSTS